MPDFFAKGKNPINGYGGGNLASKSDLTSISESGTTASQAISNGKYFYLSGTLCRAKTDIASGATFMLNTNYEVVTAGALNKITKWNLIGSYSGGTNQDISIPTGATELIANVKANQYASFSFHIILDAVSSGLNVYRGTFYTSASSFTVGNLQITDNVINILGSGTSTNGGAYGGTVTLYYK